MRSDGVDNHRRECVDDGELGCGDAEVAAELSVWKVSLFVFSKSGYVFEKERDVFCYVTFDRH